MLQKKRSTETQLVITNHDLAAILNKHSEADVEVLDFLKAFDKVTHSRLIQKLKKCNIHSDTIE